MDTKYTWADVKKQYYAGMRKALEIVRAEERSYDERLVKMIPYDPEYDELSSMSIALCVAAEEIEDAINRPMF